MSTYAQNTVAVSTAAYDGYDFDDIFASLANLGVHWIEPAFIEGYISFRDEDLSLSYAQALRKKMEHHDLHCKTFSGHLDLGAADAVPRFIRRMDFATALGAEYVISNTTFLETEEAFLKNIIPIAAHAKKSGLRLGMENTGFQKRTLLSCARDIIPLLEKISDPVIGVNYDTANVTTHYCGTVSPADELGTAVHLLSSLHLKDTLRLPGGNYQMCALGTGDVGNREVLDILKEKEISIPIIVELPLRLRWIDKQPIRTKERLPLDQIEQAVERSLNWINNQ